MTDESVLAARDRYLAENGLDTSSYSDSTLPVYFWRWTVRFPNPGFLQYHDLHHVASDYRTGLVGEAEVSAYELRSGNLTALITMLCIGAIIGAFFVAPGRVWRAWRRSRGTRTLLPPAVAYESLLAMSVTELRQHLGIPSGGFSEPPET